VQNYRRLGLTSRLNAPTGGIERSKILHENNAGDTTSDSLHINGSAASLAKKVDSAEVRVERDPETGKILRVVREDEIEVAGRKHKRSNPLEDPLNEIEMDEDYDGRHLHQSRGNGPTVVQQLEKQAAQEGNAAKKRRPRQQSKGEEEWIARLVEKHGDNVRAMFRDRKLNSMQQSEGDLRKRIRIWRERQRQ
jgi:nucleolar protein 16